MSEKTLGRRNDPKIVVVRRRTRLEELVARYNTVEQARFYVEHLGSDFSDYQAEHSRYYRSLGRAEEILGDVGRVQMVFREHLPNLLFGREDIVVAVGQDGLVANTLKYLDGQPLIGVNPDPDRWDGVLLPFEVEDLGRLVPDVMGGRRPLRQVTMAKVSLNDGQELCAVNDLFIGQRTHLSSRYHLSQGERGEDQSSSGIIVSTGLGATGWLKSVLAGAAGIMAALDGNLPLSCVQKIPEWDSEYLQYTVREPFPSRTTQATMVWGRISKREPMRVRSHMPENGVIFSDGIESDYLEFRSGVEAVITLAEKKGLLVQ